MIKNRVKEKIKKGEVTYGAWIGIGHPDVAEILSTLGLDWLVFDTEHAPLYFETVQKMMQAIREPNLTPITRVAWNDPVLIKLALDIGSLGIIVPWVNNKEEAIKAVKAKLYPPKGIRGVGPRRAARYGADFQEYIEVADEEILLLVQIETQEAVKNIDDILSVEGVDAFFIGPLDLSASLGYIGNWRNPKVLETIDKILDAGKRNGVPGGIYSMDIEHAKECTKKGFKFIALGSDYKFLKSGCMSALEAVKRIL